MEVLLILVNGLVNWVTEHWFLTFLILVSLKGIHFHFDNSRKEE